VGWMQPLVLWWWLTQETSENNLGNVSCVWMFITVFSSIVQVLLFVSFESIWTKVSFQYVQKLLHFVCLVVLTLNLFSIGVQGLYVQDYGKLWQARFESHEASCFHTWKYVMDFHASSFGPFYFWKFESWTLKDLHGFKTLFWKYWSFSCYGVDKKLSKSSCFQYVWNFDISWWIFGKYF
jgi:hypothetical protein